MTRHSTGSARYPVRLIGAVMPLCMALAVISGVSATAAGPTPAQAGPAWPARPTSGSGGGASYFPLVVKHLSREHEVEPLGQFGGLPSAIAWAEPYAYVAAGPKLVVLDIADSPDVVTVGESAPVPGRVTALQVREGFAYAIYREEARPSFVPQGIRIYDVRDPRRPRLVSEMAAVDWVPGEMGVSGHLLFVAEGNWRQVRVFDVSDPAAPREAGAVGRSFLPTAVDDMVVAPGVLYVVGRSDATSTDGRRGWLWAIDIRDLAAPRLHASIYLGESGVMARAERHLFILSQTGSLIVVDIADPATMQIVAERRADSLGIAVLAGMPQGLAVRADGYLFAYCRCRIASDADPRQQMVPRMIAIDVRDPPHPRPAVEVEAAMISPTTTAIVASDRRVLHVNRIDGIVVVVDVPDPSRPAVVQQVQLPSALNMTRIAVSDPMLYATASISASSFRIALDVADAPAPRLAWTAPGGPPVVALATAGNAIYVVQDDALYVADSRSRAPTRSSPRIPARSHGRDVAVADGRLYLAESTTPNGSAGGLRVFDIAADPLRPVEIGSLPGDFTDVAVAGSLAWVAAVAQSPQTGSGRLQDLKVLDVSDPARIRLLASFAYPMAENEVEDIAATADEAFVSQNGQLLRHRLSRDRAHIPIVAAMDEVFGHIALHGSTLIAHAEGLLSAFDIGASPRPVLLGAYTPGDGWPSLFPPAEDMAVGGGRVFVLTDVMGVWVFDIDALRRDP